MSGFGNPLPIVWLRTPWSPAGCRRRSAEVWAPCPRWSPGPRHDFVRTVTEKMLTYALGLGVEHCDAPIVRQLVRGLERDEYRCLRRIPILG